MRWTYGNTDIVDDVDCVSVGTVNDFGTCECIVGYNGDNCQYSGTKTHLFQMYCNDSTCKTQKPAKEEATWTMMESASIVSMTITEINASIQV